MSLMRDMVYGVGALLLSPVWGWRMLRTGKWRTDWAGRFGHVADGQHGEEVDTRQADSGGRTLLIHAVSVGEVNSIRLLVDELRRQGVGPDAGGGPWRIVISVTTDTGFARARQLFEPAHTVVRYPLDFTRCVRRFLDAVRPDVAALVELEVWPNFVEQCARRGIPVCVINGRLSARSYRRYRRIRCLVRSSFARLTAAAVQTQDYARHFIGLGTPPSRVRVTDSMKWDTSEIADRVEGADMLGEAMGIDRTRPIIVAGSTGPGEERLLIDNLPVDAQVILVPRKPERFDEVARMAPGIVRRTEHPDGSPRPVDGSRLFLLDTMGELRRAYALADAVIVGRSFVDMGGSDPIEPVALGKPTIVGPYHANFADVVSALREGGGIEVTDRPGEAAARLLADRESARRLAENGREVIRGRQGATLRHLNLLAELTTARQE